MVGKKLKAAYTNPLTHGAKITVNDFSTQKQRLGASAIAGFTSSARPDWETPQQFFDALDQEFGFTLDPCSSDKNAKCKLHFTKRDDGLAKSWGKHKVFMNPPYGVEIGAWMRKARDAARTGGALVVCLVPARTDAKWWHDTAMVSDEIRFVKGRLRFRSSDGKCTTPVGSEQSCIDRDDCKGHSAMFPSAVVVFRGQRQPNAPIVKGLETVGGRVVQSSS